MNARLFFQKLIQFFPFFFFLLMAQALRRSHGHLRFNHLCFLTLSTALFALWGIKDKFQIENGDKFLEKICFFIYSVFSLFLFIDNEIIYGLNKEVGFLISFILGANFLTSLSVVFFKFSSKTNVKYSQFSQRLSLFLLCLVLLLVIPYSPKPHVDVWEYARLGADHLLNGVNPYTQYYPDLYKGRYELTNGFCYWPFATYLLTLSRALFGDVRWILALFQLLSVVGLWKLSNHFKIKSLIYPLLWLSFPVTYFVLEQAWVDGLILPLIIWFTYYMLQKKWLSSAIILGMMCMSKQYMIFFAVLSFFYVVKIWDLKTALKFTLMTTFSALILVGPFLIWDSTAFIQKSVLDLMTLGFRDDALSWVAYFSKFYNFYIPGKITGPIYGITTLILSLWILKKKNLLLSDLLLSLILVFMVTFLFGKQAFCNYYHMVSVIILTYILLKYHEPKNCNNISHRE